MSGGVFVSYSSVHQAYQLALAAQEAGVLARFLCSLYLAPGKWGAAIGKLAGEDGLVSRKIEGMDLGSVSEFPLPLVLKTIRDKFIPDRRTDWLGTNAWFDRRATRMLRSLKPDIFVGTETCDLFCLEEARKMGVARVHDCPQIHPGFLARLLKEASERSGIPSTFELLSGAMAERKMREYDLAEWLLTYSEAHTRSFVEAGFQREQIVQCPLWVDPSVWHRKAEESYRSPEGPLRLLFVGAFTLRKGVPFLLEAIRKCDRDVRLTMVGRMTAECEALFAACGQRVTLQPPKSKSDLRAAYVEHDLFVLPSVVDSFGFVSLEAMACGIPVITTENCGAPVPDETWRVPAMDPEALAARIARFSDDRSLIEHEGRAAREFARKFTPEAYRGTMGRFFLDLLRHRAAMN